LRLGCQGLANCVFLLILRDIDQTKKGREKPAFFGKCLSLLLNLVNTDLFAVFAESLKLNGTVNLSEKGVVGAFADVCTGMDVSSALFNKNVACENELTVRTLNAESLGFRITAVLCGTHTFFMSEQLDVYFKHYSAPLSILM
jgi:hypothetical protein